MGGKEPQDAPQSVLAQISRESVVPFESCYAEVLGPNKARGVLGIQCLTPCRSSPTDKCQVTMAFGQGAGDPDCPL